jgi:hypothetical protein
MIIKIIVLIILYKYVSLNESKPNAIPLFQINTIFKYAELKMSDPRLFLSNWITYILESLSKK